MGDIETPVDECDDDSSSGLGDVRRAAFVGGANVCNVHFLCSCNPVGSVQVRRFDAPHSAGIVNLGNRVPGNASGRNGSKAGYDTRSFRHHVVGQPEQNSHLVGRLCGRDQFVQCRIHFVSPSSSLPRLGARLRD